MKTSVEMIRKMGEFDVTQRTSDGYFNATELINQYNGIKGKGKRLETFLSNLDTNEFVYNANIKNMYKRSRASRGENAGTWMHPFLFYKYVIWLSPDLEYFLLKTVFGDQPNEKINDVINNNSYYSRNNGTYLMFDFKTKLHKIGKTANINTRLKQINCKHKKAKVVLFIPFDIESLLHQKFRKNNIIIGSEREWFNFSSNDIIDIYNIMKTNAFTQEFNNSLSLLDNVNKQDIMKEFTVLAKEGYSCSEIIDLQLKLAFAVDMGYITSFNSLISELVKVCKQRFNILQ